MMTITIKEDITIFIMDLSRLLDCNLLEIVLNNNLEILPQRCIVAMCYLSKWYS